MSLLRLTNYQGKPYNSGFSISETKDSAGLNFLSFKESKNKSTENISQVLIPVDLGLEKGDDHRVTYQVGAEDLGPASIFGPASYVGEDSEDLVDKINISSINFVYKGRIEFELESGEIVPIDAMGYRFSVEDKGVIGRQRFEVVTTDLRHEEAEDISLYPLGAIVDPGKDVKQIEPIFFQVTQSGESTFLKTITTTRIKEAGGVYSPEGFMHGGFHYMFKSEAGPDFYQSLDEFIRSGGIKCTIEQVVEESSASSAAAAESAAETTRPIEIESCEIYGTTPDDIILGFKINE